MKWTTRGISKAHLIATLLLIPVIYLALIAVHGYRFGDEDMTETLSYALFLRDSTLFPNDFYIQSLSQNPINERFPFTMVLVAMGSNLEWGCFLLHGILTTLCIMGWFRLVSHYIKDPILHILFFFISFFFIYGINLGGNEAYYHYLVPSMMAKAIAVWSIWALVKIKYNIFFVLLIPVSLIQPVVGTQLFLLGTFSILLLNRFKIGATLKNGLPGILGFMMTAGLWTFILFFQDLTAGEPVEPIPYSDLIEARLAHHYFPAYFDPKGYFVLVPLFIAGCLIWYFSNRILFYFFLLSLLGLIIYTVTVEWFHVSFLLKSQWFKTSVWLKPLSVLALLHLVDKMFHFKSSAVLSMLIFISVTTLGWLQIEKGQFLEGRPYHFPGTKYKNPEMTLAERAREILPHDVCVIAPPYVTGFRFFSRRSLYIDYKSNLHSKRYLFEAYWRRKEIYGIDVQTRRGGENMVLQGNKYYHHLTTSDFLSFKSLGVTHCIVESSMNLDLPLVLENKYFKVYTF